jgi:dihydroxyacid dehydratase/phosphogluconate dehydratase
MVMGTAATMMSLTETLGMSLPGAFSIPAVDTNHTLMAAACGRRIVDMVWEDLKLRDIMTEAAFDNATVVDMSLGGPVSSWIWNGAIRYHKKRQCWVISNPRATMSWKIFTMPAVCVV